MGRVAAHSRDTRGNLTDQAASHVVAIKIRVSQLHCLMTCYNVLRRVLGMAIPAEMCRGEKTFDWCAKFGR